MAKRRVALVVVHGLGKQTHYEITKELSSQLYKTLKELAPLENWEFVVDKIELNREGVRSVETSDLFSYWGAPAAPDQAARERLFRPISILHDDFELNFYEAYWADEDLNYSRYQKVKYNLWLLTTIWNPAFNWITGKYREHPLNVLHVLFWQAAVFFLGVIYHLAELLPALASFVLRRMTLKNRAGEIVFEYAGDVKLYAGTEEFFHNQTKQEVILARFHEALIKAYLENDEIYVVGSSLGTVIAFDGLMTDRVHPAKMATDFLHYLQQDQPSDKPVGPIDLRSKVKALITVGSPLDKFYFFWPSRRRFVFQPPFQLERHSTSTDERPRWESTVAEPPAGERPQIPWFNFRERADPIGGRLDYYGEAEGFEKPKNVTLSRAWLPSTAHLGYWDHPGFMKWLTATVFGAREALLPKESVMQMSLRFVWSAVLAGFAAASAGLVLVFLLDFSLGMAHDLYMDAESNTIFRQLEWLNRIIVGLQKTLAFDEGNLWITLSRLFRLFVIALLGSLPFSFLIYLRNERRVARRKGTAPKQEVDEKTEPEGKE